MIEWTDALSIGVDKIDDQHRTFIGLVNRLNGFSRTREELKTILADLVCYAEVHFLDEEEWMRRSAYPQLKEHVQEHADAATAIHDMMFRDIDGPELYGSLGAFLMPWMVNHIMKHDKAFGDWLRLNRPAEQDV